MSLFVVCGLELWTLYTSKTPYYNLKALLPEDIYKWTFSPIKKDTRLAKRLLRFGQYILNDVKIPSSMADSETFLKEIYNKLDILVIDYIRKTYHFYMSGNSSE